MARLVKGAAGLPMSGLSPRIASLLRSVPFAKLNGVPDWNVVTPASERRYMSCPM